MNIKNKHNLLIDSAITSVEDLYDVDLKALKVSHYKASGIAQKLVRFTAPLPGRFHNLQKETRTIASLKYVYENLRRILPYIFLYYDQKYNNALTKSEDALRGSIDEIVLHGRDAMSVYLACKRRLQGATREQDTYERFGLTTAEMDDLGTYC